MPRLRCSAVPPQLRRGILVGLALGQLAGCTGVSKLDWKLGRDGWQRPEAVVEALEIAEGATVADLGAGREGYFLPYLAEAVGPAGRVLAVDVESELTDALGERFADQPAIEVKLGRPEDPMLPDAAVDLVLVVDTYHHIEDRPAYFERLRGDLSPGGRIAVLEPNAELGGLLGFFVDDEHASRAAEVSAEMERAGYRLSESHDFLPVQFFQVYVPEEGD